MKNYVTEDILHCVKKNDMKQIVVISKTVEITFGTVGMTVERYCPNKTYFKHLNYWKDLSASEINKSLSEMDWEVEI